MIKSCREDRSSSGSQEGDVHSKTRDQERIEPQMVQETQVQVDPRDARVDRHVGLVERLVERDVVREAF